MRDRKGVNQGNWNWQTQETDMFRNRERANISEIINVAAQTGSTQNGIELLEESFSDSHSMDNGEAPLEVQIMNMDKQRHSMNSKPKNLDITMMEEEHR